MLSPSTDHEPVVAADGRGHVSAAGLRLESIVRGERRGGHHVGQVQGLLRLVRELGQPGLLLLGASSAAQGPTQTCHWLKVMMNTIF